MDLDDIDIRILNELQRMHTDGHDLTSRQIAKKLRLASSTVNSRVKTLRAGGVIRGYKAILDAKKADNPFLTFVLIQVDYQYLVKERRTQLDITKDIDEATKGAPWINEIHTIAGEWDILLKIRGRDVDEIADFIMTKLRTINGVGRTCMYIVLESRREETDLRLQKGPA